MLSRNLLNMLLSSMLRVIIAWIFPPMPGVIIRQVFPQKLKALVVGARCVVRCKPYRHYPSSRFSISIAIGLKRLFCEQHHCLPHSSCPQIWSQLCSETHPDATSSSHSLCLRNYLRTYFKYFLSYDKNMTGAATLLSPLTMPT